ncbi:MAG: ATP-dependent DNA helicase RecG [Dehalococcoidia bacterium]|nr:ATP-dependent DNA helicase RecG [Dehalococcoidia bacterium]
MTEIDKLRAILELECRGGYTDRAVMGGLSRYLQLRSEQIRQSFLLALQGVKAKDTRQRLLTDFVRFDQSSYDYASLEVAARRRWVARIQDWIRRLEQERKGKEVPGSGEREVAPGKAAAATGPVAENKPLPPVKSGGLNAPITVIKGIAPRMAARFARLGVKTVYDLVYFFPRRYVDYSQRKTISQLEEGKEQTVIATIWQARVAVFGRMHSTETIIGDGTGTARAIWFNQPYLARKFTTNARIAISGEVRAGKGKFRGQKEFISPEWELLGGGKGEGNNVETIHTARLVPVYPLTRGLYPRQMRKWTREVLDSYLDEVGDFLPAKVKERCHLLDLPQALAQIHYPDDHIVMGKARERLAFDEFLLLQLSVLSCKRSWQEEQPGNAFVIDREIQNGLISSLPFGLTRAQQKVLEEILHDLEKPRAMARLLQGEVGSGKTVIAMLALLLTAANGFQGALMVPTEILAEQHFHNICGYLSRVAREEEQGVNIKSYSGFLSKPLTVALLVGNLGSNEKINLQRKIREGEIDIAIGTHALIQKSVEFNRLGLAVTDEQHRFGVLQRSTLRQKGFNPHVLVMTATPIPRTMALTVYGDLDLSVIDELPPGRQAVRTRWLKPAYRKNAYELVRREAGREKQAFIVCPLVEESEFLETKAATMEYRRLSHEVFPDLRLGLLHGQMPPAEKDGIMRRFRAGEFDILVATSVVEVGIDVPGATVMLVEGAERFGLSQLHQLRGRVGRSKDEGYCILIPEKDSPEIRSRLRLMEEVQNGFALAEKDMELRGPGEFFGSRQSGLPDLKVARLSNVALLELARREAIALFHDDPYLEQEQHALLREKLSSLHSPDAEWS